MNRNCCRHKKSQNLTFCAKYYVNNSESIFWAPNMVRYGARLFSRNFLGLVTFYVQLITNILKQLISDLSVFPHLLLNLSLMSKGLQVQIQAQTIFLTFSNYFWGLKTGTESLIIRHCITIMCILWCKTWIISMEWGRGSSPDHHLILCE